MRIRVALGPCFLVAFSTVPAVAQTVPQSPRNPQAVAVFQQSIVAMGSSVPTDASITGSVTIVEGSKSSTGAVRILTRGLDQSLEEITTPDGTRKVIFSRNLSSESDGTTSKAHSLERSASSQPVYLPPVFILAMLNDPESAFEYVGLENIDGIDAHHVRVWKTFSSKPKLQHLAVFSEKDVWIDAKTKLPLKVFFEQREGGGASDRTRMEFVFSDYRPAGGALLPMRIEKSKNGTLWMTITMSDVRFNAQLTEADFPVVVRRPQ